MSLSSRCEVIPVVCPEAQGSDARCTILSLPNGLGCIMMDCGCTERMDYSALRRVLQQPYVGGSGSVGENMKLILLSQWDMAHCGMLAFLLCGGGRSQSLASISSGGKSPVVDCPVYCTEATKRLGEITLATLNEQLVEPFRESPGNFVSDALEGELARDPEYVTTLADVVLAFHRAVPLQYGESAGSLDGCISVSPHLSGGAIGNACWKLAVSRSPRDRPSMQVIYLTDHTLSTNRHVSGLQLSQLDLSLNGVLSPIGLLVTDYPPAGCDRAVDNSQGEEQALVSSIKATLRSRGSVLLPVDVCSTQAIELLILLDFAWSGEPQLQSYPIAFVAPLGDVLVEQLRIRMGWMSRRIRNNFDYSQTFERHPLQLPNVRFFATAEEMQMAIPASVSRVVIAGSRSLDFGDSRDLFLSMSQDKSNSIIFTHAEGLGTSSLAYRVLSDHCFFGSGVGASSMAGTSSSGQESTGVKTYKLRVCSKLALSDESVRVLYRECLAAESQEEELKRRRARDFKTHGVDMSGGQLAGSDISGGWSGAAAGSAVVGATESAGSSKLPGAAEAQSQPLDLSLIANLLEDSDLSYGAYCSPQLFSAQLTSAAFANKKVAAHQTLVANLVAHQDPTTSQGASQMGPDTTALADYGEFVSRAFVNNWQVNSEASASTAETYGSGDGADVKGEIKQQAGLGSEDAGTKEDPYASASGPSSMVPTNIKSDIYGGHSRVKGELDSAGHGGYLGVQGGSQDAFDWRRDLQVRFGIPGKLSITERSVAVSCKVKLHTGIHNLSTASLAQRRETLSQLRPQLAVYIGASSDVPCPMGDEDSASPFGLLNAWLKTPALGGGGYSFVAPVSFQYDIVPARSVHLDSSLHHAESGASGTNIQEAGFDDTLPSQSSLRFVNCFAEDSGRRLSIARVKTSRLAAVNSRAMANPVTTPEGVPVDSSISLSSERHSQSGAEYYSQSSGLAKDEFVLLGRRRLRPRDVLRDIGKVRHKGRVELAKSKLTESTSGVVYAESESDKTFVSIGSDSSAEQHVLIAASTGRTFYDVRRMLYSKYRMI